MAKLSEKRKRALYAAIQGPIVDVRIDLRLEPVRDAALAQVEHRIWREVKKALGVDDDAN